MYYSVGEWLFYFHAMRCNEPENDIMPTNDQQEPTTHQKGPIFKGLSKLSEDLVKTLELNKGITRAKYDDFEARKTELITKKINYEGKFSILLIEITKSLLAMEIIVQEQEKITDMKLKVSEYSNRTNEKFFELLDKLRASGEAGSTSAPVSNVFTNEEESESISDYSSETSSYDASSSITETSSETHNKSSSSTITKLQKNMSEMFDALNAALGALSTAPANDHAKRAAFKNAYLSAIGKCEEAINRYPDRTLSEWFLDQCHELRVLFNTFINKITSKSNEAEADEKIAPNVKNAPNSRKIFAECKNLITDLRDEMYEAAEEISSIKNTTGTKPQK